MKNNLKYLPLFFIFIAIVSCTNETSKSDPKEHAQISSDTEKIISIATMDSVSILTSLKKGLQGTWIHVNPDDHHSSTSFEVRGDTLFYILPKEKYKIKLNKDSTFSEEQILSKKESIRLEPKMSGNPLKIIKLTEDSLVIWTYWNSKDKYIRYYKKR